MIGDHRCPAHKEGGDPGNIFTTGIRNDLERQCIGISLNALVYKYKQGEVCITKAWTQSCQQYPGQGKVIHISSRQMYAKKIVPESLRRYGEQQDIHPLDKLRSRKVGSHRTDGVREAMVLEIMRIFVMFIEILDDALLARPHKDFMLRISEVIRETRSKVSCAKH
jgi:hypothetical protein